MSKLAVRLGRLLATLRHPNRAPIDLDAMNLRDWADLPAHHPVQDRAPC